MKNFLHIASNLDITPLMLALHRYDKSDEIWQLDTYLRNFPQGPFGDTHSVILRFPPRAMPKTQEEANELIAKTDQHENVDQPAFKLIPEARKLVFDLMHRVQGERLGRVMINRLQPGGKVDRHADTAAHAEYWDRFHIVLNSQPGNVFHCGDEMVRMKAGECWWFNNKLEHEVFNNSTEDRINMVVDIRTSKPAIDSGAV